MVSVEKVGERVIIKVIPVLGTGSTMPFLGMEVKHGESFFW